MIDTIEQILEARQKRAEALHDMILEAREIVREKLHTASPEEERSLYHKLQAALYTLRGDPFDMHMRAALTQMPPPAGETIRSTQDGSMEVALETGQSPVGAASAEHEFSDFEEQCPNCGGDGVVYMCLDEIGCIDPEGGCDMCERRCDWCRPKATS